MKFSKEALFNFLIIFLVVVGSLEFYQQLVSLSPRGVADRLVGLASKYSLWIGLGLKLLDWLIKQKDEFQKSLKSASSNVVENQEKIKELYRLIAELEARALKVQQDFIVFKAETSVRGSLGEIRQELNEIQHKLLELDK